MNMCDNNECTESAHGEYREGCVVSSTERQELDHYSNKMGCASHDTSLGGSGSKSKQTEQNDSPLVHYHHDGVWLGN